MKKLLTLSIAALLLLPAAVYAASIGGAETVGQGEFSIGLDQEIVFGRDGKTLTQDVTGFTFTSVRSKYEIDKMYRTMVKVSYGLLDNLDIYTRLGTASPDYKVWSDLIFGSPSDINNETWKYKGRNAFAYGLGLRGTHSLQNGWLMGVDAQYLRHRNKYKATGYYFEYTGGVLINEGPMAKKGKVTFFEWHIAPYVAVQLDNFVPYLGARYSDARINEKDEHGYTVKTKSKHNVGVFVGTDYKIDENWKLNIEGRFVDETAMSAGATYRF